MKTVAVASDAGGLIDERRAPVKAEAKHREHDDPKTDANDEQVPNEGGRRRALSHSRFFAWQDRPKRCEHETDE